MEEDPQQPADESMQAEAHRKHQQVRLRNLRDTEDRVRVSLRLETTVDKKLDQLAALRGLDRNTAISVAIAQDWIACFGPAHAVADFADGAAPGSSPDPAHQPEQQPDERK